MAKGKKGTTMFKLLSQAATGYFFVGKLKIISQVRRTQNTQLEN